jgi:hypothetical protein
MGQGAYIVMRNKMQKAQDGLPVAPTAEDITDDPAQTQLNMLLGGRTSTILSGYSGEDANKLKTSKLLLGGG